MNNLENNKLIAEFLCTTQKTEGLDDCYILKGMAYHIEDLKFDTDWNWIIPVVEKIESLGYWLNKIDGDYWIVNDNGDTIIDNTEHSGGIIAVYNACVEFIKWYEQNK